MFSTIWQAATRKYEALAFHIVLVYNKAEASYRCSRRAHSSRSYA